MWYRNFSVTNNIQKGGFMTTNQIQFWNLREQKRANTAKESISRETNEIERGKLAATQVGNVLRGKELDEAIRANLAREAENIRSHQAAEGENVRTHKANEEIAQAANLLKAESIGIDRINADTAFHNAQTNRMNAITNQGQLAEAHRTNLRNEEIKSQNLDELTRSNIANENIKRFSGATQYANASKQAETAARQQQEVAIHNRATELNATRNTYLDSLELQNKVNIDSARTINEFLQTGNNAVRNLKGVVK